MMPATIEATTVAPRVPVRKVSPSTLPVYGIVIAGQLREVFIAQPDGPHDTPHANAQWSAEAFNKMAGFNMASVVRLKFT